MEKAFSHLEVEFTIKQCQVKGDCQAMPCWRGGGHRNARLLLASNRNRKEGLGNKHDIVGRFLNGPTRERVSVTSRAPTSRKRANWASIPCARTVISGCIFMA